MGPINLAASSIVFCSRMAIFTRPEFAEQLVLYLSRSELGSLAALNRTAAEVFRPHLFARITITLSGPLLHWAMHEDIRYLRDHPHLAHLIADLTVDGSRHASCCSLALVVEIMLSCSRIHTLNLHNLRWCLDETPVLLPHSETLRSLFLFDVPFSRVSPLELLLLSPVWFTVELTYCDMFAFLLPVALPVRTVVHNLGIFGLQATRRHPRVLRAPDWLSKLIAHSIRVAIDDSAIHELAIVLQSIRPTALTALSFVQPADEDRECFSPSRYLFEPLMPLFHNRAPLLQQLH